MSYRVGIGYDIHKFAEGRKLVLGGVEIPYNKGLDGHSDADVLLHAICDALLGAVGKGDIGEHFPNTDPQYKDIASSDLLERVYELILKEGYVVNNLDTVLQMEEPKIVGFKDQMKGQISKLLFIDESFVNIKATTQEGLGAVGNKEGIAAFASVLLVKKE